MAFDLDLANMFGSIEWPSIRLSVAQHFAAIASWIERAHQQPSVTTMPYGEEAAMAADGTYISTFLMQSLNDRLGDYALEQICKYF